MAENTTNEKITVSKFLEAAGIGMIIAIFIICFIMNLMLYGSELMMVTRWFFNGVSIGCGLLFLSRLVEMDFYGITLAGIFTAVFTYIAYICQ